MVSGLCRSVAGAGVLCGPAELHLPRGSGTFFRLPQGHPGPDHALLL